MKRTSILKKALIITAKGLGGMMLTFGIISLLLLIAQKTLGAPLRLIEDPSTNEKLATLSGQQRDPLEIEREKEGMLINPIGDKAETVERVRIVGVEGKWVTIEYQDGERSKVPADKILPNSSIIRGWIPTYLSFLISLKGYLLCCLAPTLIGVVTLFLAEWIAVKKEGNRKKEQPAPNFCGDVGTL
jgi:hypothetical protein